MSPNPDELWDGKTPTGSRGALVHVVQPAEDRSRADRAWLGCATGCGGSRPRLRWGRLALSEATSSRSTEPQVALVQDDAVVEARAPEGADHPLRDRVGPGCPDRGEQDLDPQGPGPTAEVPSVDGVRVAHEVAGRPAPRGGLEQLPPDPGGRRVCGHIRVHELPSAVGDEHQDVQRLEGQGLDGEAVGRPDLAKVVGQLTDRVPRPLRLATAWPQLARAI